jgi:hypothetical protein
LHIIFEVKSRFATSILIMLTLVLSGAIARADYDVVVDIDWTILSPIPVLDRAGRTDLIFFEGEAYAPAPFMMKTLDMLFSHPDVRVHVFSGGTRARNLAVLAALKFSDGTSLLERIQKRGGQVWSQSELTPIGTSGGNIDRYRKRIENLLPKAVAERLILIDDQTKFGDTTMKAIPSYGVFNDRLSFDASKIGQAYEPVNSVVWKSERNRWLVLAALLEAAFAGDRAGKFVFRDYLLGETHGLALATKEWKQWTARGREIFLPKPKAISCENLFAL